MKRITKKFLYFLLVGIMLLQSLPSFVAASSGDALTVKRNLFAEDFQSGYTVGADASSALYNKWSYVALDTSRNEKLTVESVDGSNVLFLGVDNTPAGTAMGGPGAEIGNGSGYDAPVFDFTNETVQITFRFKDYEAQGRQLKVTGKDDTGTMKDILIVAGTNTTFFGQSMSNTISKTEWMDVKIVIYTAEAKASLYLNGAAAPTYDKVSTTALGLNINKFKVRFTTWLWGENLKIGYYLDDVSVDLMNESGNSGGDSGSTGGDTSDEENLFTEDFQSGYTVGADASSALYNKWSYVALDTSRNEKLMVESIDGSNVLFLGVDNTPTGTSMGGPGVEIGNGDGYDAPVFDFTNETVQISFSYKDYNAQGRQFKVTGKDDTGTMKDILFVGGTNTTFFGEAKYNTVSTTDWVDVKIVIYTKEAKASLYLNGAEEPLYDKVSTTALGLNINKFKVRFTTWLWGENAKTGYYLDDVSVDLLQESGGSTGGDSGSTGGGDTSVEGNLFKEDFQSGYTTGTDATMALYDKWSYVARDDAKNERLSVETIDGSNVLFMGVDNTPTGTAMGGPGVEIGNGSGYDAPVFDFTNETVQITFRFKDYEAQGRQFKVTGKDDTGTMKDILIVAGTNTTFFGQSMSNTVSKTEWVDVKIVIYTKEAKASLYLNGAEEPLYDKISTAALGLNINKFKIRFTTWLWGNDIKIGYYLDDVSVDLVRIVAGAEETDAELAKEISFTLVEGGQDVTNIGLRAGDIRAAGTLRSTGTAAATFVAYTALYRVAGDGLLLEQIDTCTMADLAPGDEANFEGTVTVPEDYKNYVIRVFVWSEAEGEPVTDVVTIEADPNYFLEDEQIADEFDALRARWKNYLVGGLSYYDVDDADIKAKIQEMDANVTELQNTMQTAESRSYLWADQAYSAQKKNPATLTGTFGNLKTMAIAYKTPTSTLYHNATLRDRIIDGLDWAYANWYNEDIEITDSTEMGNWWEWEIGAPQELASTMALMYSDLTEEQLTNYSNALSHWCPNPVRRQLEWVNGPDAEEDGANRVWKCTYAIIQGIVMKDSARIEQGRNGLDKIFVYVDEVQDSPDYDPTDLAQQLSDGFYSDGTFIQHGKVVYNGGYGASLLKNIADAMYILGDSRWDITAAQKAMTYEWIVNAYEPIIYKGALMDIFRGTGISNTYLNDRVVGHEVIRSILQMSEFLPETNKRYVQSMVKYWVNADKGIRNWFNDTATTTDTFASAVALKTLLADEDIAERGAIMRNKVYAEGDRVVHLTDKFGLGISMSSERIFRYSSLPTLKNNQSGWYTNAGMTTFYDDNFRQYESPYWPVQDKNHLPGTTVERRDHARDEGANTVNDTDYAGGATLLDKYGAAGLQWVEYGGTTRIKKSWFMFDDEVVCLGGDLHSTAGVNIDTTIDNRPTSWELPLWINNVSMPTLTANTGAQTDTMQYGTERDAQWAWFGVGVETGYYFPTTHNIDWKREIRTGSWNSMCEYNSASWKFTQKFLSMIIDHGVNPDTTGSAYEYVILPKRSKNDVIAYAQSPDVEILDNNASVQAVREKELGITAANFFTEAQTADGAIACDGEASVLAKLTGNTFDVAVSDPTHNNTGSITLTFAQDVSSVVTKDDRVTVVDLAPLTISIDVNGGRGRTVSAQFSVN